jgi:hypothetical protein
MCRDLNYENYNGRVSHIRIDTIDSHYQLVGCTGNESLKWEPYRRYDDPKHASEWCRPVPFPHDVVTYDHLQHGGYMDMDFLSPASSLTIFNFHGQIWAKDILDGSGVETILARPTGSLSFANLYDEKVRITRGEVFGSQLLEILVANGFYSLGQKNIEALVSSFLQEPSSAKWISENQGSKLYTNQAISSLEAAF